MPNLRNNILLHLDRGRLDADLAAGRSPETSQIHATHARRLVRPLARQALAASWEHLLAIANAPPHGISSRVPVCRERVLRAESEINEMITALRASGPMPVRGVAIAAALLSDGCGPVYNPRASERLVTLVARAVEHLDPAVPLSCELLEAAHDPF
jgi:hypothetical protein